eukprot:scaffold925_cov133-Isochrysis_galbana.AAC.8
MKKWLITFPPSLFSFPVSAGLLVLSKWGIALDLGALTRSRKQWPCNIEAQIDTQQHHVEYGFRSLLLAILLEVDLHLFHGLVHQSPGLVKPIHSRGHARHGGVQGLVVHLLCDTRHTARPCQLRALQIELVLIERELLLGRDRLVQSANDAPECAHVRVQLMGVEVIAEGWNVPNSRHRDEFRG